MIALLVALAGAQESDFRSHLDQARFFLKRGWTTDALDELETAVATEDGRVDPEVWWLLAQVRLELGDLAGAEAAAESAHSNARTDEQLHAASALAGFLRETFGTVHVDSDPGGLTTRLELSVPESFLDPAIGAYVERLAATHLEEGSRLPVDLQLPLGAYTVNGQAVEVSANTTSEIRLTPDELLAPSASQLWRGHFGIGTTSLAGISTAHGPLGPSLEAGVRRLAGPISFSAEVAWRPQAHARADVAPVYAASGSALTMKMGAPIASGLGVWTPALGYRIAAVPGVELACTSAAWVCDADGEADLFVYATAWAHGPLASLWLEFGDAQRKSVWAPGVRANAGLALAGLPSAGSADVVDGASVDYTVASGSQRKIGFDLGIAFTLSHGL